MMLGVMRTHRSAFSNCSQSLQPSLINARSLVPSSPARAMQRTWMRLASCKEKMRCMKRAVVVFPWKPVALTYPTLSCPPSSISSAALPNGTTPPTARAAARAQVCVFFNILSGWNLHRLLIHGGSTFSSRACASSHACCSRLMCHCSTMRHASHGNHKSRATRHVPPRSVPTRTSCVVLESRSAAARCGCRWVPAAAPCGRQTRSRATAAARCICTQCYRSVAKLWQNDCWGGRARVRAAQVVPRAQIVWIELDGAAVAGGSVKVKLQLVEGVAQPVPARTE